MTHQYIPSVMKLLLSISLALLIASDTLSATEADKQEFVPQWAKSVIWYQIFPERFRDGDTTNNPQIGDILQADPQEAAKFWQIHPWNSDWYELQDYEKKNAEPEMWKHLLRRRYGGDLQGIINKLDYLKNLGITAIYLNPVFDSPSLHKYDAASYHHIDPNFGPDPVGDRLLMEQEDPLNPKSWVWTKADKLALKLIDEVHKRDMRIIFDGVFNHMGISSFAFKNLIEKQQQSPYKDWFIVESFRDEVTGTDFEYKGWFGVKSLPEFKENEQGIVPGPKEYIYNATKRWMNPDNKGTQYGIDGWRLDVAYDVSHQFWKTWRKWVRSINPQAYMTAEIVDTPDKVTPYFQGDEFDGEMNYNFAFAAAEFFFNPKGMSISVSEFDNALFKLRNLYPSGVAYVNQNLFGSHDSNRIGSHIVNRGIANFRDWGKYFNLSQAINNSAYNVRKPNNSELQLQKLFVIMQMTNVGAPMIYYGDEVGMWGANDPDSRKPMLWNDITYQDEHYNADGSTREPDTVVINNDLFLHYKKLITIRNQYKALQVGNFKTTLTDDEKSIYGFKRSYKNQAVHVIINNSSELRKIPIDRCTNTIHKDILNSREYPVKNKKIILSIKKKWAAILICE